MVFYGIIFIVATGFFTFIHYLFNYSNLSYTITTLKEDVINLHLQLESFAKGKPKARKHSKKMSPI